MENVNAYRIVVDHDGEDEVYTIEQMSSAGEWEVATESNSLEGAGDLLVSDYGLSRAQAELVDVVDNTATDDAADAITAIKNAAMEQTRAGLERFGVPSDLIEKAYDESVAAGNTTAMTKLFMEWQGGKTSLISPGGGPVGAKAETAIVDEIADAMAGPTKEGDGEKELSEEEKERRKEAAEARKVLMEEAEKVEEVVIHTLQDAQRVIRAGMLLAAGAAGMIKDSGLMGHLDEPMQRLLQNLLETERGYQAELAGDDPDEDDGSSVPDLLKDFLKRSELEKAEREAEEEAERVAKAKAEAEAAAKAAAAKTAPWHGGSDDDDEDEGPELSPEERAAKEAEQKKIDEFFGGSIF